MPQAVAAAAAPPGRAGQGGQQQQGGNFLTMLMRMGMMWYMFNMFRGGQQQPSGAGTVLLKPLYAKGDLIDMKVFLSERAYYMPDNNPGQLIWEERGIGLASGPERKSTYMYEPSQRVKHNASVWLHAVFSRANMDPDAEEELPPGSVFTKSYNLIRYLPRPKNKTGVNLLGADGAPMRTPKSEPSEEGSVPWVAFYKPNATIAMVDHFQAYSREAVPQQLRPYFEFADAESEHYLPLIYFDEFWLLRDKLIPMNDTVEQVPLHLDITTSNFYWMQMQQQLEQSFQMQVNMGIAGEGESDEVKRIFLEGNPYLLALTMVVSLLHTVFDFLAFKNDVTFWKDNRSMEGLSARSIMVNAFCQLVILLYLFDNDTSTVVLISSAVGTAIEFWKVTKAFDVSLLNTFPFISVKDKASYKDSRHNTNKHDAQAMRYLSYALYPCVIGYSIYALLYETHKSWYSWVVGSLVGAVYTFGFILMCPQLYLNYKLKSVAHLPWRQMTYKFLNTIIDDLFAFVIKMPTLHRLAVFRDDIIFLIFLYQRWIYRVDKSRVNEFGFSQEMEEERARKAAAAAVANGGARAGALPGPSGEQEEGEGEERQQQKKADGVAEGSGARRRKQAAAATEVERAGEEEPGAAGEGGDSRKDQ